jgi:hypothetical protein
MTEQLKQEAEKYLEQYIIQSDNRYIKNLALILAEWGYNKANTEFREMLIEFADSIDKSEWGE